MGLAVSAAGLQRNSDPILPDADGMTPGDTLDVTVSDICTPGYSKRVRDVPGAVKQQVYAEYGIRSHKPHQYEIDHLISLELGGSNSVKNLWPQSYLTQPWNAKVKDALENELHRRVCSHQVDLATAQHEIATDWIAAYRKYVHNGASQGATRGQSASTNNSGARPTHAGGWQRLKSLFKGRGAAKDKVWVNTPLRQIFPSRLTLLRQNENGAVYVGGCCGSAGLPGRKIELS